jgi:hypothetical protein
VTDGARRAAHRRRAGILALALAAAACGREGRGSHAFPIPGDRGGRVVVEVLNASGRAGLARSGTRLLRRAGIDVVHFGNAPAADGLLDSTRILLRRGDAATAQRVREALGVGKVVVAPEPDLLLDVSVLLGADFSPRLELHP